jgi:diaminopimelate decarboxylase
MTTDTSERQRQGWPSDLDTGPDGLRFGGCSVREVAERYGTPLWLFSRAMIEENFARFQSAFRSRYPQTDVAFSMKSQNTMAVVRLLHAAGAKSDCTGENEMQIALQCGVPPEDIILNGNGKSDGALRAAAELGVAQVNLDSLDEASRLERIAAELGVQVNCAVRVQLTYEHLLAEDPSFETTLRVGEGKFGNNIATGDAMRTVEHVVQSEQLRFVGLHHHVGFSGYMGDYTPEREVMHHAACTAEVCAFAGAIEAKFGVRCERLDLGGGFRGGEYVYLADPGSTDGGGFHPLPAIEAYVDAIVDALEAGFPDGHRPRIQFETGGYQVADAAIFIAKVVEVKPEHGAPRRDYVVLDGSMQMFTSKGGMRVANPVLVVDRPDDPPRGGEERLAEIVGQACVYDSLAENVRLPAVERGDLVALLGHGAYSDTTGTQMNALGRPASVLVDRGRATLVKRHETLADVVGRNIIPSALWQEAAR